MNSNKVTNYSSIPTAEPVVNDTGTFAPAIATKRAVVEGTTMVSILAPATLPEGYVFDATYEGTPFKVTVPHGSNLGVREGQEMVVPFQEGSFGQQSSTNYSITGRWKDGLCDCFKHGVCHPSLICACCCPLILLGQVMTRLRLNWIGDLVPYGEKVNTLPVMVFITLFFVIWSLISSPSMSAEDLENINADDYDTLTEATADIIDDSSNSWNNLCINLHFAVVLFLAWKVRKYIRTKNQIPEKNCVGCEDFCCSFWCAACVVSQVARQTADYDQEAGQFCTTTGIDPTNRVMHV